MNPEPSPAADLWPDLPPKNCSNTSAGTCSTTCVWTVTTDGATRATACVMAVRRDATTPAAVVSISCDEDCGDGGGVEAPWHATMAASMSGRRNGVSSGGQ